MEVFDRRRDRLLDLLKEHSAADIARSTGIDPTVISRYAADPELPHAKRLGEKNARRIEAAAGKPQGWLDKPSPSFAGLTHTIQSGNQTQAPWKPEHAPQIKWESILKTEKLPALFWVELPDDAMAPRASQGVRVCFDKTLQPKPGDGVLVADKAGSLYFRIYRTGAGSRWSAHALNDAYAELESERDGLRVIAVLNAVEGRWS